MKPLTVVTDEVLNKIPTPDPEIKEWHIRIGIGTVDRIRTSF